MRCRSVENLAPSHQDLERIFGLKYGNVSEVGWGPRIRRQFSYFTPDEYYEAVVDKLVTSGTVWLDVGCGRNIFPSNGQLARQLSQRCAHLVGVDPDETIEDNVYVHERVKLSLEQFEPAQTFHVVTMRMVAEHVANPQSVIARLARLTKPGGHVVIYTVDRWSPVPIITWATPFMLHHPVKRVLWQTDPKDTFPVSYLMNTRGDLKRLFEATNCFREASFAYLDDCRTFARFRVSLMLELAIWKVLHAIGLSYPERCLLGVYRRM